MPGPNPARRRIPRVVNLPFGVRIKVKQVGKRQMEAEMGDGEASGGWMCAIRTIFIKKTDSPAAKRDTLYHELMHVLVDIKDEHLTSGFTSPTTW